jgi:hypothetical protein
VSRAVLVRAMGYQPAIASGVAALHNQLMSNPFRALSGTHFLAGPAHQDLRVRAGDRGVVGLRLGRHIGLRSPLMLEELVGIDPADQGCTVVVTGNLAHIGRKVADREPSMMPLMGLLMIGPPSVGGEPQVGGVGFARGSAKNTDRLRRYSDRRRMSAPGLRNTIYGGQRRLSSLPTCGVLADYSHLN